MNAIALGMNLFLAALLMAALAMGWRLNIRLRGVRESQALFVKAVTDLDAATGRAHAGLAELRMATEEAIDLLGGRIVRAKEAADRLDRALGDAEMFAARRPAPAAPMAPPPAAQRAVAPQPMAAPPAQRGAPPAAARAEDAIAPTSLRGLLELAEGRRPAQPMAPRPRAPLPQTAPAPRPRASFSDDDLFVGGGLR